MYGRWGTGTSVSLSNLKLLFSDGTVTTIMEAVQKGYVEPLVLCGGYFYQDKDYVFPEIMNILNGGNTGAQAFPICEIMLKVTKVKSLKGISFDSSGEWSVGGGDGLRVKKFDNLELSTEPF